MERHDFIVAVLVKTGFRTSLRGFDQFCECVELYSDDKYTTVDSIYRRVAEEFCCSKSSVEKNLRRLFASSDAGHAIGRLFGTEFSETGNKEIIATFSNFIAMNRDCYEVKK